MNVRFRHVPPTHALLVLLLLVFPSCGVSGDVSSASATSTASATCSQPLHVLLGLTASVTMQKPWMQGIAADFHKATGCTVVFDTYASSNEEQTKLQTAIASGSGPDVFSLGTSFVPTAQATKGFVTLSDDNWKAVGGKERFFKQQLTMSGISPTQQIGVPWVMRPFVMVYNKDLFKKAGIISPPTTWTEFVQDAQAMTDASTGVYGTAIEPADSYDVWKVWWMFAGQMGGQFLSPDFRTAQLNSPEAASAAKFWFDWVTTYKIADPASMTWKSADMVRAFGSGKVGMLIMVTPGSRRPFNNAAVKGKYAYAPMPTIPYGMSQRPALGMPTSTIVSGDMLAVANYSNMKDEAYKFINLLTDTPHQLAWNKIFSDLPANVEAANKLAKNDPQTVAFIQAEQGATPTPFAGSWGSIELELAGVSSKLASDIATNHYDAAHIQVYLDQANQQIQSQLH